MKPAKAIRWIIAAALLLLCSVSLLAAAGRESPEDFLFAPLDTIITASGMEQSIDRAPTAMTVINAREIHASGALSIPELLRFIPGMDIVTVSSSHAEVNVRGLSQVPADKLLVLVDGRSVYLDYYGGVIWESLPLALDQIERIEVVRSPASALYGANAFSGVINIITKAPARMAGPQFRFQAGERGALLGQGLYGGVYGPTSLRLAVGGNRIDSFEDSDEPAKRMFFGNFLVEHRLSHSRSLSLDVGGSQGHVRRVFIDDLTRSQISSSYFKFNCLLDDFSIQAFWNRTDQEEKSVYLTSPDEKINSNTVDLELQYKKNIKWNNSLVSGVSVRHNSFSTDVTPADQKQNLTSFYLQDEYRPIPELSLLAGCRVDHHPLTKTNVSPRFSLICAPDRVNTLRISVARAYRNPSFQNSELDYKRSYRLHVLGNRELKAEKVTSTELGYTFFPGEVMKFKTDLFFLRFHDNIFLEQARQEGDFLVLTFNNRDKARSIWGFESSLDFIPIPYLKFNLNYSFQRVGNGYFVGAQQSPPRDKANCKVSLSPVKGMEMSLSIGHTSSSKWIVVGQDGEFELYGVPAHSTVDTRLGYSAGDSGLELFVAGYNLLDNKVREYPVAEQIRRRVTVGAYWTY